MRPRPDGLVLRLLIDEGVPNAVGRAFEARGHGVIYANRSMIRGSPDQLVCAAALAQGAILVAADHDMKRLARAHGVGDARFKSLSLVKLTCRAPDMATHVEAVMSLIEHEWEFGSGRTRRLWVEIQSSVIRVVR